MMLIIGKLATTEMTEQRAMEDMMKGTKRTNVRGRGDFFSLFAFFPSLWVVCFYFGF